MDDDIIVEGIETNNLKNINIRLSKNSINLILGPSGSGKSSLAYETIAQIGQHEFLSMFADNILEPTYKVKSFKNMLAAIPIKQSNHNNNSRSTIGTYFGLNRSIGYIYSVVLGLSEELFVLNKEGNLCNECHGLGFHEVLDEIKIIDYNIPLEKNPFKCWNRYKDFYTEIIKKYCADYKIDSKKTFRDLTNEEKNTILYGESKEKYSIRYKKNNTFSRRTTKFFGVMTKKPLLVNYSISKKFYTEKVCPYCNGKKYGNEIERYKLFGLSIGQFMCTPFFQLIEIIQKITEEERNKGLSFTLNILMNFIKKAIELNLGHLYFHRTIPTLSGGELQRLRMVQVFNTQLTDLLIVLDEPLSGLSGKEKNYVYESIVELSKKHTIIVVDHSEKFINISEKIITLGEKGGTKGGYIIDNQKYLEKQRCKKEFLAPKVEKEMQISINNSIYGYLGAEITLAMNCMNLITGYSGVGKSTLLREYLPQYFKEYLYINQKPLLGNKNSSVATVLDISNKISDLFAKKFSKDKKYFSNLTGNDGMCKLCNGSGYIEYGDKRNIITRLECEGCSGTGFTKELKKYKINDKSILDVWKMTISEGISYFKKTDKKIVQILMKSEEIMLGHLRLGQATRTLSGGENIRIKILKSFKTSAKILGIDEPFKGLSQEEIFQMVKFIENMRENSKTIIIVDHTDNIEKYFSKKIILKNRNNLIVESNVDN